MAVLTALDEPELLAADSPAAAALRLRQRGNARQRTVPLSPGKCTIGSSPQCQVCLPTPEVRPLQCLITLESDAALVTRWATGVRLNGKDFSKAELRDGDRLTIGEWEIEFDRGVVAGVAPPTDQGAAHKSLAATPQAASRPAATDTPVLADCRSSHAFADSLVLHLWTANYRARRRAKALITDIRAARFQADAMAADLSAMETELDLARAAYDSHLGNDNRLQKELAEHKRQNEQLVAPLMEEIAALRSQLEQAQAAAGSASVQPASDVWSDVAPLVEEPASVPAAAAWDAFPSHDDEPSSQASQAVRVIDEPACASSEPPTSSSQHYQFKSPAADTPDAPTVMQPPPQVAEQSTPTPTIEPQAPAWAVVEEPPAPEFTSTSFIDKYRHLLEDDNESPRTLAPKGSHPVIDDEFLSPAKVETCASPADESDEALEAYMAGMMRRVRSNSPTYVSSQTIVPTSEAGTIGASRFVQTNDPPKPPAEAAAPDFLAEEPFSFEALKHATRKLPLASDLTALREIANSSARGAIATHSQKRSHESAMTKIALALTATVSAAYLMASAPAIDDWQFWAGAATCAIGITAAVQVLIIERRGAASQPSSGQNA